MVYIVDISPAGQRDFGKDYVFDSLKEANAFMYEHYSCNAHECDYRLYSAINEFTAKRRLIKQLINGIR